MATKEKEQRIYTSDAKEFGLVVGSRISFCRGCQQDHDRLAVRWKDGSLTYPCAAGMKPHKGHLRIL